MPKEPKTQEFPVETVQRFIRRAHPVPEVAVGEVHDFLLQGVPSDTPQRGGLAALAAALQLEEQASRRPGQKTIVLKPAGRWCDPGLK